MQKTHRAAVILHVERVARAPERFGEGIHDLGVVIKRIRDLFRVRPVALSEADLFTDEIRWAFSSRR